MHNTVKLRDFLQTVKNLNARHYKNSDLTPGDFTDKTKDPLLDEIKPEAEEQSWRIWKKNQERQIQLIKFDFNFYNIDFFVSFDKSKSAKFKVGQYVYLKAQGTPMSKESDLASPELKKIYKVDARYKAYPK